MILFYKLLFINIISGVCRNLYWCKKGIGKVIIYIE